MAEPKLRGIWGENEMARKMRETDARQLKGTHVAKDPLDARLAAIEEKLGIMSTDLEPPPGSIVIPIMLRHAVRKDGVEFMEYVDTITGAILARTYSVNEYNLKRQLRKRFARVPNLYFKKIDVQRTRDARSRALRRRIGVEELKRSGRYGKRMIYTRAGMKDPEQIRMELQRMERKVMKEEQRRHPESRLDYRKR